MNWYKKKHPWFVLGIVVLALGLRLVFAFSVPEFTGPDAYFRLRQVESILKSGLPLFIDPFSFSGRTQVFTPVYEYVLSFFVAALGPTLALKLIPNVLIVLVIPLVYLISKEITRHETVAVVTAFAAAFIPVVFSQTVNSVVIETLMVPLTFYLLYCFMRSSEKAFLYQFIVLAFVVPLVSALSFFVVLGFLVYLLLIKLEYRHQNRVELELILFFTTLVIWVEFLVYKRAFLFHGYHAIWQNIPVQILQGYFAQTSIVGAVKGIGIVPLILGTVAAYQYLFRQKSRELYLLVAFTIAATILLWLRLINLSTGLILLGSLIVVLMSLSFRDFFAYVDKTKAARFKKLFFAGFVLIMIATSVIPSLVLANQQIQRALPQKDVDALRWLENNTPRDSIVVGMVSEGEFISALARRKNIADTHFFLINNPDIVLDDIKIIYTSIFQTRALERLDKYRANYVYLSRAKQELGVDHLKYADANCFPLIYDTEVKIYEVRCHMLAAEVSP
ncbi:glycosyltransferase family 39 protein [Candidatus Woesearchaeota archaeon]|nr:glycosyltransferase family 39 protein [Candidatus Woesearchaeota archaeon]